MITIQNYSSDWILIKPRRIFTVLSKWIRLQTPYYKVANRWAESIALRTTDMVLIK